MRIIEGTVEEIVKYQQLTAAGVGAEASSGDAGGVPEAGTVSAPARSVRTLEGDDGEYIRQYVTARAMTEQGRDRVLHFLERALKLGTSIEPGTSQNTEDGLGPYLMIRDDGPQRFGAVVYVKPHNLGLTVRLRPEDVVDMGDSHIQPRDVVASQQYALNCPLVDDAAVEVALTLTERALAKVRSAA